MTLALSGIIISMVVSFFLNNANQYNRIDNDIEIQYQAQSISNFMKDKLLEAKGLKDVINEEGSIITSSGINTFKRIVIDNNDDGAVFELKNINEIWYRNNTDDPVNKELGKYIKEMKITSIPETTSYKDAQCVKIEIIFRKDGQAYTSEQNIYFRNSN